MTRAIKVLRKRALSTVSGQFCQSNTTYYHYESNRWFNRVRKEGRWVLQRAFQFIVSRLPPAVDHRLREAWTWDTFVNFTNCLHCRLTTTRTHVRTLSHSVTQRFESNIRGFSAYSKRPFDPIRFLKWWGCVEKAHMADTRTKVGVKLHARRGATVYWSSH